MRSLWRRRCTALAILLIATFASALLGCSAGGGMKPKPSVPPGGILLQGAGATFPSVLYQKWFADYQKVHPTTVISYDAVGSGEGVHRFLDEVMALAEIHDVDALRRFPFVWVGPHKRAA